MKVIYINDKTEFTSMGITPMKKQNKYGTMYSFDEKCELITTQPTTDYYVFHSTENGKLFHCIDDKSQIGVALKKIRERLITDHKFTFKAEKDKLFIRMNADQLTFPKI
jgi:hypothetical protein